MADAEAATEKVEETRTEEAKADDKVETSSEKNEAADGTQAPNAVNDVVQK